MQLFADSPDREDDRVLGLSGGEKRAHVVDEPAPKRIPDALVECRIAEYGVGVRSRSDEDQRDVSLFGAVQAGPLELLTSPGKGVHLPLRHDAYDDVPGRAALGFANRALDARVREARHGEKLTVGALCAELDAWKYGLAAKRDPKRFTMKTVGAVAIRVSNACASSL